MSIPDFTSAAGIPTRKQYHVGGVYAIINHYQHYKKHPYNT